MAKTSYYWAGDKKIPLEPSADWAAVDFARLGTLAKSVRGRIEHGGQGRVLRGSIHLVPRRAVPDEVYVKLDRQAAAFPVYRHGKALLVVLPEVRIEAGRSQRERIQRMVGQAPHGAAISEQRGQTVVLRPASGRGVDALALANKVYETVHPRMVQARFVRIVPKPDTWRRDGSASRARTGRPRSPQRRRAPPGTRQSPHAKEATKSSSR